jgi:clan AA aspartic protease (TIGR02281 family)
METRAAMLRWSFGYLAMAIVVAVGFSSLQGGDRPGREVATATAKQSKAGERSARPRQGQLQDEGNSQEGDPDNYLEYVVEAGPDGHYLVEALVNGAPVTFLVDTGASDIVLNLDDARRVGLEPRRLGFTQRYSTANGEVRGAPVVLREIRIGQLNLFDVSASVNEAPLEVSLLGMSFLEQLSGYQVERGRLILRW